MPNHIFKLLSFLALLFLSSPHLSAIAISPLKPIVRASAGERTFGQTIVTNDKAVPVTVEVELAPSRRTRVPVERWLRLKKNVLHLEAKQSKALDFEVNLPKDAQGEFYAKINYTEKVPGQVGLSINLVISTPIFVSAKGSEVYQLDMTDYGKVDPSHQTYSILFRNQGNVHLRPHGVCNIISVKTEELLETVVIGSPEDTLYPGKSRTQRLNLERPLPPGKYLAAFELSLFKNHPASEKKRFEFVVE